MLRTAGPVVAFPIIEIVTFTMEFKAEKGNLPGSSTQLYDRRSADVMITERAVIAAAGNEQGEELLDKHQNVMRPI